MALVEENIRGGWGWIRIRTWAGADAVDADAFGDLLVG